MVEIQNGNGVLRIGHGPDHCDARQPTEGHVGAAPAGRKSIGTGGTKTDDHRRTLGFRCDGRILFHRTHDLQSG